MMDVENEKKKKRKESKEGNVYALAEVVSSMLTLTRFAPAGAGIFQTHEWGL